MALTQMLALLAQQNIVATKQLELSKSECTKVEQSFEFVFTK